jgi:hypothetical protein
MVATRVISGQVCLQEREEAGMRMTLYLRIDLLGLSPFSLTQHLLKAD